MVDRAVVSLQLAADHQADNSADSRTDDCRFSIAADSLADYGAGAATQNKTAKLSIARLNSCCG
jgi:hypothetical protein